MEFTYQQVEDQIKTALQWYDANPEVAITVVAKQFGVPYGRLYNRIKGRSSRNEQQFRSSRLNVDEEAPICEYIERLAHMFIPPRKFMVVAFANSILHANAQADGVEYLPVSCKWLARFLKRHSEFHVTKMKVIDRKRALVADADRLEEWFRRYAATREENGILPSNVWNMDETGFQIAQGSNQTVVVPADDHLNGHQPRLAIPENRELVTVIEAISANGNYIDPYLIFKGKKHVATIYGDGTGHPSNEHGPDGIEVPSSWNNSWLTNMSDTGYTNDSIALDWIDHFARATQKFAVNKTRLLLVDQHGSHCTREFLQFCDNNDIILFGFPPHSTHFIQPCDVGLFGPYKHHFTEMVNEAVRIGYTTIGKQEFLSMLAQARAKAMKPSTIISAFKRAGIEPINAQLTINAALGTLAPVAAEDARPVTPPCDDLSEYPETPNTCRCTKKQGQWLLDAYTDDSRSKDDMARVLSPYVRGTRVQSILLEHTTKTLSQTKAARHAQEKARKTKKWHCSAGAGGRLMVGEARDAVLSRVRKAGLSTQYEAQQEDIQREIAPEDLDFPLD